MAYSDSITSPTLLPISSTTKENLTSVASKIEELNESMSKLLIGIQGLKEKIAPQAPKLLATLGTLDLSLKELEKELEKITPLQTTLQAPKLLATLEELDLAIKEQEKELKKRKRDSMRKEIVDNLVFIVTFVTCQLVFPRTPFTPYPHLSPWQNWVLVYHVDCGLCLVFATQIYRLFRSLRVFEDLESYIVGAKQSPFNHFH